MLLKNYLFVIDDIYLALEKQQIMDAYDEGEYQATKYKRATTEQYYSETFKK